MHTIVEVRPLTEGLLLVRFATGEEREFDVRPFAERSAFFRRLIEPGYFRQVRVAAGTISWPEGHDFDPGTVYVRGMKVGAPA